MRKRLSSYVLRTNTSIILRNYKSKHLRDSISHWQCSKWYRDVMRVFWNTGPLNRPSRFSFASLFFSISSLIYFFIFLHNILFFIFLFFSRSSFLKTIWIKENKNKNKKLTYFLTLISWLFHSFRTLFQKKNLISLCHVTVTKLNFIVQRYVHSEYSTMKQIIKYKEHSI
jgi:hypothetical protein